MKNILIGIVVGIIIILIMGILSNKKQSWYGDSSACATLVVDCQTKVEQKYTNIDKNIMKKLTYSASLWITRDELFDDYGVNYGVFYKKCVQDNIYQYTPTSYLRQRN